MKRGTVIGIVIAAVLVAGVGGAAVVSLADRPGDAAGSTASETPGREPAQPSPSVSSPGADPAPTPEALDATAPGEYVQYSEAALADAAGTPVLFFHAPWCPQCRALDADIVARGVPAGVTILKVDYDTSQALRERYGVTLQTTVVAVDESGGATATFVPYDEPTLDSALAGLGIGG